MVRKSTLLKHQCEEMKRHKAFKTQTGQAAFAAYQKWLKFRGYREPTTDQFLDSRHFKPFLRFVIFSKKVALPAPDKFLEYMAKKEILPKDWTSDLVYQHYIDKVEKLLTYQEQAEVCVNTISELARIYECETSEVFQHMTPNTLIRIVQAKKLLPIFLLNSTKFRWFKRHEMARPEQVMLEHYMDSDHWNKIIKESNEIDVVKQYVNSVGI